MKNNTIITILSLTALIAMTSCAGIKEEASDHSMNPTDISAEIPSETAEEILPLESNSVSASDMNTESSESSEAATSLSPEQLTLYTAYHDALKKLLNQSILPDGKSSKNKPDFFLIQDVDNNSTDEESTEELILAWTSSSSFGDIFYVYQYDTDTDSFHVKWNQSSAVKLFDKGTVLKPVSVNYGLSSSPDFYPYGIYQYQKDKNTYSFQAYVDAWQKSFLSTDYAGNAYPSKIDTENAGMVYSISYCREGTDYVNDYNYSQSMYEDFCNENFGDQITTDQMNVFNIEEIENILMNK